MTTVDHTRCAARNRMTVDASRSGLGLATSVGSAIRRPRPQPCPEVACRMVRWRLPWMRSRGVVQSDQHDRPVAGTVVAEPRQSTGDRSGHHIGRFAGAGELTIARAQPKLRLPGDLADRFGLSLSPEQQLTADPGREAI